MAASKQAFDALFDAEPALRDVPYDHPVHKLDEAGLAQWVTAWMAGVRAGAADEHLRQAMVAPRMLCARCHGHGRLWAGRPYRNERAWDASAACPGCGGAGAVATPAPAAAAVAVDGAARACEDGGVGGFAGPVVPDGG